MRDGEQFLGDTVLKSLPANAGDARDVGSIPGLVRSLGIENGNPLQYSSLENSMDRGAWQAIYSSWVCRESDTTEHTLLLSMEKPSQKSSAETKWPEVDEQGGKPV